MNSKQQTHNEVDDIKIRQLAHVLKKLGVSMKFRTKFLMAITDFGDKEGLKFIEI